MPLIAIDELARQVAELFREPFAPAPAPAAGGAEPSPPGPLPLDEMLRTRRSVREFTDTPLGADALRALVASAWAGYRMLRPAGARVTLMVSVTHPAGLYPAAPVLAPVPDDDPPPALGTSFAAAPAHLLICGDAPEDGSGYRAQLVDAGALGHAAWLSALSAGLGASMFGGNLGHIRGLRHLLTVAVGYPRADAAAEDEPSPYG